MKSKNYSLPVAISNTDEGLLAGPFPTETAARRYGRHTARRCPNTGTTGHWANVSDERAALAIHDGALDLRS